jgi:RimJ/RimL family protein N-acetyltransferase
MADVFDDMITQECEAPTLVIARIDRRNLFSERFAERNGFSLIDDLPEPDQLRNWFTTIERDGGHGEA